MIMSDDPREVFGQRVRLLREKANLSQEGLAALCGLHRNYVGGIERGERNVSLLNIVLLSRGLGVKVSYLLEGID